MTKFKTKKKTIQFFKKENHFHTHHAHFEKKETNFVIEIQIF